MAVSAEWYGNALVKALGGSVNYLSDTIKVMLATSSYTPNQDTDVFKSAVTNEIVGTGYTAGGLTLGSKTLTYTGATNVIMLDAADVQWTTATITNARYAIIYDSTGTDSTSVLIGLVDFGGNVSSNAGNFTIAWDAAGMLTGTVS